MIKQLFVILCEEAIIEKDTNKLYILGIFDNISASKLPVVQPKFTIVTKFEGGTDEHKHKIVIKYESGEEAARLEGIINFGPNQKAQYIGRFIGFPFSKFGKYMIEIYVDNDLQPLTGSLNVAEKI